MSLTVKRKKANRIPPVPGGSYISACIGIIDVGEQYDKFPGEKQGKYASKVIFLFELVGETVEVDGEQKPRWLSLEMTQSLHERAALYKTLTAWLGRPLTEDELSIEGCGFDLAQMLGKNCMLSVSLNEKDGEQYNKITGVMGVPKGLQISKPESEPLLFDIDDRDEAVFAKLPEWIQKKIEKSTQYQLDPPEETPSDAAAAPEPPEARKQPETAPQEPPEESGKDGCPI